EHDALVGPAHRPVDLPDQLARAELAQQHRLAVAALAGVGHLARLVVVGLDRREVLAAARAVGLVGVVLGAARAVVLGGRAGGGVERRLQLLVLVLGGGQGAELRQDRVDLAAVPHGVQDLLGVGAGGVLLGLADA